MRQERILFKPYVFFHQNQSASKMALAGLATKKDHSHDGMSGLINQYIYPNGSIKLKR